MRENPEGGLLPGGPYPVYKKKTTAPGRQNKLAV